MTFSYTDRPSDNVTDEVRFLIQDNKRETHFIEDEEITYTLTKYENDIYAACALLCETMAQRHAQKQEQSVSNYKMNVDSVYSKLIKQAGRFRSKATKSTHFRVPSISQTAKDAQESDSDNTPALFKKGILDNPQAYVDPFDRENLT